MVTYLTKNIIVNNINNENLEKPYVITSWIVSVLRNPNYIPYDFIDSNRVVLDLFFLARCQIFIMILLLNSALFRRNIGIVQFVKF